MILLKEIKKKILEFCELSISCLWMQNTYLHTLYLFHTLINVHTKYVYILHSISSSAFCDNNEQFSSLYCSCTVFCSFLDQLLTCFITNKKHKVGQRLLYAIQCHCLASSISLKYFDWQIGKVLGYPNPSALP